MSFSMASTTNLGSTIDCRDPDNIWVSPTASAVKPKDVLQAPQQQKRAYASYAEATASDQVSGITDSDPSPRDAKHKELSTRIASLEAMITTLVYQVQQLTSIAPATQGYLQAPNHTEVPYPQGKRQDVKECPEKINDHMIIPQLRSQERRLEGLSADGRTSSHSVGQFCK
jgi:hypothetical protein